jgi:hypothetical protein
LKVSDRAGRIPSLTASKKSNEWTVSMEPQKQKIVLVEGAIAILPFSLGIWQISGSGCPVKDFSITSSPVLASNKLTLSL